MLAVLGLAALEKSVCFSSANGVVKTDVFLIFVQYYVLIFVVWCCVLPRAQPWAVVLGCSHFLRILWYPPGFGALQAGTGR